MQPSLGWTLLSKEALRRAETQLRDDVEGVRDEIGFLALHQAYADRFFPGTSVLHTRLRYVLFVPWIYYRLAQKAGRGSISAAVEEQELLLTRRLKQAEESGVIGGRSYPNPTAQPPSMIYWTSIGAWRILRPTPGGVFPSRQTVHRVLARVRDRQPMQDDDKQLLIDEEPLFYAIPEPPAAWSDVAQRLDFQLTEPEKLFLRKCLVSVLRCESDPAPSLLARLVEQRVEMTENLRMWSTKVRGAADQADREALIRSERVASLAAIGRAVYAALVEEMREKHDKLTTENIHRGNLKAVIEQFAGKALALKVEDITIDAPSIPKRILEVLSATQSWVRGNKRNLAVLYEDYKDAESQRKGRRARLPMTLMGRERRAEWLPEKHSPATPLHYRWDKVRQLLIDLQGGV